MWAETDSEQIKSKLIDKRGRKYYKKRTNKRDEGDLWTRQHVTIDLGINPNLTRGSLLSEVNSIELNVGADNIQIDSLLPETWIKLESKLLI